MKRNRRRVAKSGTKPLRVVLTDAGDSPDPGVVSFSRAIAILAARSNSRAMRSASSPDGYVNNRAVESRHPILDERGRGLDKLAALGARHCA
jgi:hypothetical protein